MKPLDALWYLGRGTGIVALVLFTLTLVLGIVTRSGRSGLSLPRFGIAELHKTASLTAVGLIAVHMVTLLFDPYAMLRITDLFIPFLSQLKPLWQGLGTLSVDILVLLVGSSLMRHRVGQRTFRAVHWTAYALWPFAFIHALGMGTDAHTMWFRALALACALAVTAAVGWRVSSGFGERGMPRIPRKAVTR